MQLNTSTDYAVRIMLHLARTGRVTTAAEIAKTMVIPPKYVPNIAQKLRDRGLVEATYGAKGGYSLAKDPDHVNLLEILEAMDDGVLLNRCLQDANFCSRNGVAHCLVHQVYKQCQEQIQQILRAQTLTVLLKENEGKELGTPTF